MEEKAQVREGQSPIAVGIDERIDKTKVLAGEGVTGSKRFVVKKEEHATVIFWPGETFQGHVVPELGTGRGLAASLAS